MIAWKYKFWRAAGVVAIVGATACSPAAPRPEAPVASAPPAATGGEAGIGESGGEGGGIASAYAGLEGDQLLAMRLQHLRGYVLAAQRVTHSGGAPADAALLVQQGLTDVVDPAADQFGAFNVATLRAAARAEGATNAQMQRRLHAGDAAIETAAQGLRANHADMAVRLVDVATMIYQTIEKPGSVDVVGYQRSMGAVLAARAALASDGDALRQRDPRSVTEGLAELDRLAALYPSATPPAHPATYREVLAQSSRVRLALSPLL